MTIRSAFTSGQVLTAADLTDTIKGAFINTSTATTYTLGTADSGNLVTVNNNAGGTVTIPANATWGAATGTLVNILNAGTAGSFTIGTAAGVTLNGSSVVLNSYEAGQLVKTATNTWYFVKGGGLPKATYSATTGSPTVTTVSGKTCVQFTGSGSITIASAGLVDILLVGGGGGGGTSGNTTTVGGGGGGGGYLSQTVYVPAGSYTVTVGAGGASNTQAIQVTGGNDSSIGSLFVAVGGGRGGGVFSGVNQTGGKGGSGGGSFSANSYDKGYGVTGQGNDGGNGTGGTAGGGGGGAGAAGSAGVTATGGNGGNGLSSSITGSAVTRGGGGGGAGTSTYGTGGTGGGANGGTNNGTVNTGGGGGGNYNNSTGGNGGSGIAILLFG